MSASMILEPAETTFMAGQNLLLSVTDIWHG